MSYDVSLLTVVSDKSNYLRFKEHVKKYNVSSVTKEIFDVIGEYWDNYPSREKVDIDELQTFFYIVKSKGLKNSELYHAAFNNYKDSLSNEAPIVKDILAKLIETDYATQIYNECLKIGTGRGGDLSIVGELLDQYTKESGSAIDISTAIVRPDLTYLKEVVASKGLSWRLKELNVSVGPLRKGDFIIVGARPETGKTTFMASESTWMLQQLQPDESIVWFNNEEASNKVMMRVIQAHFQVTGKELLEDIQEYESGFLEAGGNRFLITSDDSGLQSVGKITAFLKTVKPGLIVFDQLDKVHGMGDNSEHMRLGMLYKWARDLAKEYCPVIALSQVSDISDKSDTKWIGMEQLRGSKTDKAGEADAIITIGKSDEPGADLKRYIRIPKNKLFGGTEALEAHRHGCFEVEINPARAHYVSKWRN